MIKSMTGYGKGRAELAGLNLTVEIKTVNHRYADVTVKAPRTLLFLENDIKKRVSQQLKRGKIDIFVSLDFTTASGISLSLNRPLAAAYVDLYEQMRTEFAVDGGIPLALLAAQKDVISLAEGAMDEAAVAAGLMLALDRAVAALQEMRLAEGRATLDDLQGRLTLIRELLQEIENRAPQIPLEWQAKLAERLQRLQKDLTYDPQRVAQEIALFADRCDISEEITRYCSHLEQFQGLLATTEPVGRQLDFLVQELNREVNTMGSKSNDAALTRTVVAIKAELEKIREQVQNVE